VPLVDFVPSWAAIALILVLVTLVVAVVAWASHRVGVEDGRRRRAAAARAHARQLNDQAAVDALNRRTPPILALAFLAASCATAGPAPSALDGAPLAAAAATSELAGERGAPAAAVPPPPAVEADRDAVIVAGGALAPWTGILCSRRQVDACNAALAVEELGGVPAAPPRACADVIIYAVSVAVALVLGGGGGVLVGRTVAQE